MKRLKKLKKILMKNDFVISKIISDLRFVGGGGGWFFSLLTKTIDTSSQFPIIDVTFRISSYRK